MRRRWLLLLSLLAATSACSAAEDRAEDVIAPDPVDSTDVRAPNTAGAVTSSAKPDIVLRDGEQKFVGIYGASPHREGHAFNGTYLEMEGGRRLILTYGAVPEREAWIGKRVVVVGSPYRPEGRSVAGEHVKARIVELADPE
ncbi:MAG: hypothetical protein U0414_18045 [Polyangiaceae bacterium]